jgi:hypothetical protein
MLTGHVSSGHRHKLKNLDRVGRALAAHERDQEVAHSLQHRNGIRGCLTGPSQPSTFVAVIRSSIFAAAHIWALSIFV